MFERIISSDKNGFTLIEVLLSITIFGILTIGLLQFFNQAMNFSSRNEDKTMGIYIAKSMVDYMEQQSFDKIYQYYLTSNSEKTLTAASCGDQLQNGEKILNLTETIKIDGQDTTRCKLEFSPKVNSRQFEVTVEIKRLEAEDLNISGVPKDLNDLKSLQTSLIPIKVRVGWNDQAAELKGYIASGKNR